MTVEQLYEQAIRPLPTSERLRLATLILNEIPPNAVVDDRDEWDETDLREFQAASWAHAVRVLGDEPDA